MSGLEEAVLRNISAVGELSEIVRTSFGPNGMSSSTFLHSERQSFSPVTDGGVQVATS